MLQIRKGFLALIMLAFSGMNAMQLVHRNNDFFVEDNNSSIKIQRAFMDKELRGIDTEKLSKLAAAGAYLKLNKMEDSDDYTLRLGGRLNGGGPIFAAWAVHIGVVGTNVLGHGALMLVSSFSGPAAPAVYAGLAAAYSAPILAASKAVGLGLGVAAAVAPTP